MSLIKRVWDWMKDREPAELKALYATVIGLLADLGITLTTEVEGEVGFWVGVGVVLLTQVQAFLTRRGVISPKTHREELEAAREPRTGSDQSG